jgi:plasmid stabilization system protein ParE
MTYRITERASEQISQILSYSLLEFGRVHQENYRLLLAVAMEDLAADSGRMGTKRASRSPGIRAFELRYSRNRLPRSQRVRDPWHKIVYWPLTDGIVEILVVVASSYPSVRAGREGAPPT